VKTARYRKTLSETSQRQLNLYALVASLLAGLLLFGLLPSNASAATKYQVLYSFQGGGSDGAYPVGALTFDTAGNLYGSTYFGGNNDGDRCDSGGETGCGTIFRLAPSGGGWTEGPIYLFCSQNNCTDGAIPNGNLIFDTNGTLYGTTMEGGGCNGACGFGTAFQLTPGSNGDWQYGALYDFMGGSDGAFPNGGLIFDRKGNLYGTGVAAFVLTPNSGTWAESVICSFSSDSECSGGYGPAPGLVWGADGDLYGATTYGRSTGACYAGCGVVFKLVPRQTGEWKERVLHVFFGADGTNPASGPIFDSHGNLYGTTVNDGAFGNGTIYELSRATHGHWKYTVLHEFRLGELEGNGFNSGLVFDKAGNLYGTAWSTGGYGDCTGSKCGVIYKLSPGQHERWKYTELYTFTGGSDGGDPGGNLVFDQNGNLYGTAEVGGANGLGVIFEVTP